MSHTTRYGNTYSDREWAETQAFYQTTDKVAAKVAAKFAALKTQFMARLQAAGVSAKGAAFVAIHLGELDELEANGVLCWETPQKKAAVLAAVEWYCAEGQAIEAEAERVEAEVVKRIYGEG